MSRCIIVDIETTGLLPGRNSRIIEIGAVAMEGAKITEEFHSFINPGLRIPNGVQRIHGITDEMLAGKPRPHEVLPLFHKFIRGGVLVAHNARFDMAFLRHEFALLGLDLCNSVICTLELSRRRYPRLPNHRLETLARHLLGKIPKELRLHRALDDARLTARVWMEMMGK